MLRPVFFILLNLAFLLAAQAQTFSGSGAAIPDNYPTVVFSIPVTGLSPSSIDTSFGLESVCINLTHPWVADLQIVLKAPDGTQVDLSIGNGGSGDNYTNTCFDGNSPNFISTSWAPFTGTFRPQGILGTVNNLQNGNGTWQLLITDVADQDSGNLLTWSMTFGNNPSLPFYFTDSNLPLVIINTNNAQIPDEPKIVADMGIIDNGLGNLNHTSDAFNNYNGKILIEKRGSSSQTFPQKSYAFTTTTAAGIDSNASLLGMPAEHDWILYAPYDDKTLMRNIITYQLSRKMGNYAPRTILCELFLNGDYQGIYVLMEKIKRDLNRVDIAKLNPADISGDALTGGYIIKIDKQTGVNNTGWTSSFAPAVHPGGQTIFYQYHYPESDTIVTQQKNYIRSYVDSFETALTNVSVYDTLIGYRKFMDENSFIDFFIMNEISKNVDGYRLSTYLYKDRKSRGGKLFAGPLWDFNLAWWNADYCGGNDYHGWAYKFGNVCSGDNWQIPFWWDKLFTDSLFRNHLHCRWEDLRANVLDTTKIFASVDSMKIYLNSAQQRHFTILPILGVYTWPNPSPIPTTYDGEIDALKKWIRQRIKWLDDSIPGNGPCPVPDTSTTSSIRAISYNHQTGFTVFPNPFTHAFQIELSENSETDTHIQVVNIMGEKIIETSIPRGTKQGDISAQKISSGFYYLFVDGKDGRKCTPLVKTE